MADDLDSLKKYDLGQLLMSELGYDQETVDWYYNRYTAERLRTVIRNFRAHDIITKLASKAGSER